MTNLTKIGIVFPMRNCLELTQAAVASIETRFPYQIYLVDDHSDPPSKVWIASRTDFRVFTDPPCSTGLASNWNIGIAAAFNDGCTHALVCNTDIVFHPETIDRLVERLDLLDVLLVTPNDVSKHCGAPEVLRFWDIGKPAESETPEFGCFMITEQTLTRVGWFDDGYLGAYYEDNDYHTQMVMRGTKAVRLNHVPYYHYGSRTSAENRDVAPLRAQQAAHNQMYFHKKWGGPTEGDPAEMRRKLYPTPFGGAQADPATERLDMLIGVAAAMGPDIREHLGRLSTLSSAVTHVTDLCGGTIQATAALLHGRPKDIVWIGKPRPAWIEPIVAAGRLAGTNVTVREMDSRTADPTPTDLLFIDTWHVEEQMRADLERHATVTRQYMVMHDTETFARRGATEGHRGIWPAIAEYVRKHPEWRLMDHFSNNNGLSVFARGC